MFEEFTEEYFMDQARALGDEYGVDTRQGSLFMDAAMVMSFDFKTMAEKSGINGKGGEKVVAKLTDALKSGQEMTLVS